MRGLLTAALFVSVMLGAPGARAQSARVDVPRARLVYERTPGAEQCPDESELRERVASRLGEDPFEASESDLLVLVTVELRRRSFGATVRVISATGEAEGRRELGATRDCSELTETVAVAIALALESLAPPPADGPAGAQAQEMDVASPPTGDAEAETPPLVPHPLEGNAPAAEASIPVGLGALEEAEEAEEDRVSANEVLEQAASSTPAGLIQPAADPGPAIAVSVTAYGGLALGWQPNPSGALGFGAGVSVDAFSTSVRFRWLSESGISRSVGHASTSWIGGSLDACGHLAPVALCGVIVAGLLRGAGAGVEVPRTDESWMLGAGLEARLAWAPLEWLELAVEAEGVGLLIGARLVLDGVELWRSLPVAGFFGGSLSFVIR